MRLSLSMANPANRNGTEFRRVVLVACSCRVQQNSENLRVRLSRPTRGEVQQQKDQDSPEQTGKQVECRRPQTHGEEEEFSLRPENRQRARERPMDSIHPSCF